LIYETQKRQQCTKYSVINVVNDIFLIIENIKNFTRFNNCGNMSLAETSLNNVKIFETLLKRSLH